MDATITLGRYLGKGMDFVVPEYQRGYIWGKRRPDGSVDSVTNLLCGLVDKYRNGATVFLQGITVTEDRPRKEIVLIDGQQRTTFLYLLLKYLGYRGRFELRYDIREESVLFLRSLDWSGNTRENPDDEFQDRYFFTKSLRLINDILGDPKNGILAEERGAFVDWMLENVRFLYINIPAAQARKVFAMMNGSRAKMLPQEVIKAELLRLVSRPSDDLEGVDAGEAYAREWELNMLRSRYAREWDRWLHWWNRHDVRMVFNVTTQLGWLLLSVMPRGHEVEVSFDDFCDGVLGAARDAAGAKRTFDRLRRAQKRFEDTFQNPIRRNKVGAILRVGNNPAAFIKYYFAGAGVDDAALAKYYLCSFLGMPHEEIVGKADKFHENVKARFDESLRLLKLPAIFEDDKGKEMAYRLLLRLNIDEDNCQEGGSGREFDFSIWTKNVRSLDHIYCKSKVYHISGADGSCVRGDGVKSTPEIDKPSYYMWRDEIGEIDDPLPERGADGALPDPMPKLRATEHCIGNLVLLYNDDNKAFNDRDFDGKKELFLIGQNKKEIFKSRHLLHTIYRFAEKKWEGDEIRKHFRETLMDFYNDYKHLMTDGKQD